MPGYCSGTSELAATEALQKLIAVCWLPSLSFTGQVQVVQPWLCPGVMCAVRVTPPSLTWPPSATIPSTFTGGKFRLVRLSDPG